jgi:hypothetical protein
MQRKIGKTFFAGMFSVALALSLAACNADSEDNPHADFYGTWVRQGNPSISYAITETILGTNGGSVAGTIDSWGDRIENPSTVADIKAQYPYGYGLTVTTIPGTGVSGGGFGMFLSIDKQSFRGETYVYLKQ